MAPKVIVEGRMGTTLSEGVLFRMVMNAVLITISNTRATAQNAIVRHDFGLPAIMTAVEMPICCPSELTFHKPGVVISGQK